MTRPLTKEMKELAGTEVTSLFDAAEVLNRNLIAKYCLFYTFLAASF